MKCLEPYPDGTYQECQLDLGHAGDHVYLDIRWPRPVPAEPDPAVEALIVQAAAGTYGLDERAYPVVVEETVLRVIWVTAGDEDAAITYYGDDYTDVPLQNAHVLDGTLEFRRPDLFERQYAVNAEGHGRRSGPETACPDCGHTAFHRAWFHDPYRKCHGPIVWRPTLNGRRAYREHHATPVHQGVAA
ncbi:hypothetical protein [Streptomyces sp. NPDC058045]|uniref:hypothetical protein n=1 Tax=Streptomyces sp. NPDC058045 TaxID=3346311 RepID=UPI0036E5BCAD